MSEPYWLEGDDAARGMLPDEDIITCEECGEEFDYKQYKSFTCEECENQHTKEKRG